MIRTSIALALLLAASPALADLAHGTPLFTCTPPIANVDGTAIPATGTDALKEIRWYLDTNATPIHVTAPAAPCEFQTISKEISSGSHTIAATAVNNALQESLKSNILPFSVPVVTPNAPTAVKVQ